jgi:hypothetical protein
MAARESRPLLVLSPGKGVELAANVPDPATELRGSTPHFQVFYDPHLAQDGEAVADFVLQSCEGVYAAMSDYFGGITPPNLPFQIKLYLRPSDHPGAGLGGAAHGPTCADVVLLCDVKTNPFDAALSEYLYIAEMVEVFSAAQGPAWYCGASNGEGLSRVLATAINYSSPFGPFFTAPDWLRSDDRPDVFTKSKGTDTDRAANGGSVLFLNWLRYQLNFPWRKIVLAGAPSLAETFTNLTGLGGGPQRFLALAQALFPNKSSAGLATDNPFPYPTYKLVSRASGNVLEVPESSPDDRVVVQQAPDNGGLNQQWLIVPVGAGFHKIVSQVSGKVLDVTGASTAEGTTIIQYPYQDDDNPINLPLNQYWQFNHLSEGTHKIVSKSSNMLLTARGTQIQQFKDGGGADQQWQVMPFAATARIVSRLSGDVPVMMEVPGFSTADGAIIQLAKKSGALNQQWRMYRAPGGAFKIVSQWSGKVLDVPHGSRALGTKIQQYDNRDSDDGNQQYVLGIGPAGTFLPITTSPSSDYLEVPPQAGSVNGEGAQVQIGSYNGGPNQLWQVVGFDQKTT